MGQQLELLKKMTECNAPSGFELPMTYLMQELFNEIDVESIRDNTGSIFGVRHADSKHSILLLGHLDEIGFMVTDITENGFIKFTSLGYWSPVVMTSQKVTIHTRNRDIRGVIGGKPPHVMNAEERNKVDLDNMFIDIGTSSKAETIASGIQIGDSITPYSEFEVMENPKYLLAKAFDNRFGCALAYEVLKNVETPKIKLFSGAVTQEETMSRGAKTAAQFVQPSLAIAIDVCFDTLTPGMEQHGTAKMGKGPVILLSDAWHIAHVSFKQFIIDKARENGIDIQFDHLTGGYTDAGHVAQSNTGIPAVTIAVPTRYIHSNVSMMHRGDYQAAVDLVTAVVEGLCDGVVEKIINQTYGFGSK
ncbi:M42 family metallopeptidase [Macrococcoides caseolyticum]|uniref:M42 family metallopeptidase n=1 Tax=Macrococcoides caseolyticum TaxID=69966 RepID=UPI001F1C418B|nr:M42 family metallopeptidase [Macrococcus caseolyticus]MCE4956288.1 M42 family metallopeptidase [Macrococcus caseolyticus]